MSFSLHPRLAADSTYVGDFALSQLRLQGPILVHGFC